MINPNVHYYLEISYEYIIKFFIIKLVNSFKKIIFLFVFFLGKIDKLLPNFITSPQDIQNLYSLHFQTLEKSCIPKHIPINKLLSFFI